MGVVVELLRGIVKERGRRCRAKYDVCVCTLYVLSGKSYYDENNKVL